MRGNPDVKHFTRFTFVEQAVLLRLVIRVFYKLDSVIFRQKI